MIKVIITYFVLQTLYVILNTIKSILTIKSTKTVASISSAICYAVYVFVLIYTVADFSIWIKAGLTALTNFIGTYVSMAILDKFKKDKLWEITATVQGSTNIDEILTSNAISYNSTNTNRLNEKVYHIYSKNQKESHIIRVALNKNNAKYIVHEEGVRL